MSGRDGVLEAVQPMPMGDPYVSTDFSVVSGGWVWEVSSCGCSRSSQQEKNGHIFWEHSWRSTA